MWRRPRASWACSECSRPSGSSPRSRLRFSWVWRRSRTGGPFSTVFFPPATGSYKETWCRGRWFLLEMFLLWFFVRAACTWGGGGGSGRRYWARKALGRATALSIGCFGPISFGRTSSAKATEFGCSDDLTGQSGEIWKSRNSWAHGHISFSVRPLALMYVLRSTSLAQCHFHFRAEDPTMIAWRHLDGLSGVSLHSWTGSGFSP
ncbi:conserved hypothetical protein [Clavispora lusitaniae ATCC 42720]|uniref:Uncharacterized protein n=1 Tax=Clavispora lusitaniae (strain ATCC 42720) TaxID=306902 RepID=C4Y2S6_CLAL4|nr:uncharacterized protein CLUG_02839 [Clavispora lusitaniae ATCC 42720]EEQ38714.1 conserved hypothetical protein [Clavispora lusitaniae ATCC 42720]